MSTLPVVYDEGHQQHDPPFELNAGQRVSPVYERPERVIALHSSLVAAGCNLVPARPHGDEPITAVHDPDMVAFLRDGYTAWVAEGGPEVMLADTFRSPRWAGGGRRSASPIGQLGWWCFDTATPLVAGSYAAARTAVDVALTGVDLLLEGSRTVYALTRPPGHHAGRDYFGGFCLLNNAAIAAHALSHTGRVAVLDVDVHHGNGTQDVFWRRAEVAYVSLHGDPDHLFPYFSGFGDEIGEGPGRGTTRNLPLGRGTDDGAYLDALRVACEVVDTFDPAVVVVSLGFDASVHDPLGSLGLTAEGFVGIGRQIGQLGRPVLLVQEGGYALEHLGELSRAVVDGLASP